MPLAYSHTSSSSPTADKVLWVDDYIQLADSDQLTPITGSFGFKTYVPANAKHLMDLTPEAYLDFFRAQLKLAEAPSEPPSPTLSAASTVSALGVGELNLSYKGHERHPFPDADVYDLPIASKPAKAKDDDESDEENALDAFIKKNAREGVVGDHGLDMVVKQKVQDSINGENARQMWTKVTFTNNMGRPHAPSQITQDNAFDAPAEENALDMFIKQNSRKVSTEPTKPDEFIDETPPTVVTEESKHREIVKKIRAPIVFETTSSASRAGAFQGVIDNMRPPPFQYTYAVHYHKAAGRPTGSANDYSSRQTVMCDDVPDVEMFWRVFNNIPWNVIPVRDSVHVFLAGVLPQWEDPANLKGGSLTIRVKHEDREQGGPATAQWIWEEIAMAGCGGVIEGEFDDEDVEDNLLGMSFRSFDNFVTIALWLENGSGKESVARTLMDKVLDNKSKAALIGDGVWKWHHDCAGWEEATGMKKSEVMDI